jgi:ferrous-iron efflux pump FieF
MQSFIQVHIELDPALSLRRAHEISDEAEAQIRVGFPLAEIIIHQDLKGYERPAPLAQS